MISTVPSPLPLSDGERLLARSRRFFLLTLVLAIPTALLGWQLLPTWSHIAALEGAAFLAAATAFGLGLIALPLGTIASLVAALFLRTESNIRPGRQSRANAADLVCTIGAVMTSLLPASWPASKALRALLTGGITIRQPIEHHFSISSDPLAFWENVTFWLLAAAALAGLAAYFWRSRWLAYRTRVTIEPAAAQALNQQIKPEGAPR
ncbi:MULTISPECIES: hypothetical protein [unclassified Niveibacterium]|uniref:hypothetical protein n=1 Tax=unclassified Niveibacterium TaxID=2648924 RepID=UPI001553CE36|nr:hypothetical protein [Niveibacterium sp. COAC-50]